MILNIFLLLFIISLVLVFSGFIFQKNPHLKWFSVAGALLLIVLGLLLWNDSIDVPTGSFTNNTIGANNSIISSTETTTYDVVDTRASTILAWICFLGGLYAVLQTVAILFQDPNEDDDSPNFDELV